MDGRQVQQYLFLEKLGAGGMGEIYKAQDTRLNRIVAVKVLPSAKSGDPDRRRRFLLEAQASSSLNHPSIITIHDIISEGDTEYMVMEYVQGKTLNDLIPKGGLRVPQVIKYALQMADALSAAHAAGIVHRDLKPANVMVTESGLVKILDFGLAKLTDPGALSDAGSDDETRTIANTAPLTVEGSIMGTVSYMSPEQAQGKKIDTRSDIFSFGAVLYEMSTGRRAFEGESSLSTLSAILRDDVKPMSEVAPDVPPALETVFQRCLKKNPDDRWQSIKEAQLALSALKQDSDSGSLYTTRIALAQATAAAAVKPVAAQGSSKAMAAGVGVVVILLVAGGGWFYQRQQAEKRAAETAANAEAQAQAAAAAEPAPTPPPPELLDADGALNNEGVLEMVKQNIPLELILSQIRSSAKTNFDLSPREVIRLSKGGVTPLVIEQMRTPKRGGAVAAAKPNPAQQNAKQTPAAATVAATPVVPASAATPAAVPIAAAPAGPLTATPAPAAPAAPQMANATVPDALPFKITLAADIPAEIDLGQAVRFVVAEDFSIKNVLVLAKGAAVTGEITETPKKKRFGFGSGKLSFKLNKAEVVGGHQINVRAVAARRSDGPTQRAVETGAKTPKELAAAQGTAYIGYIDGEQVVAVPQR